MTFTAQELQHRIQLQRRTLTQDPMTGEMSETWATYAEPFAKVEPLVGREYFAAAAIQAENTVKFTLRWRDDVTPVDRLLYGGIVFDIQSVLNIKSRNREILIMAKSRQ